MVRKMRFRVHEIVMRLGTSQLMDIFVSVITDTDKKYDNYWKHKIRQTWLSPPILAMQLLRKCGSEFSSFIIRPGTSQFMNLLNFLAQMLG